ncbi:hypothetical protein GCM10011591_30610 [Nocardia camponoti]|uniref:DUF8176 domain-containing protein n=1 Tax=Nocardia camponoti TaxID=1616106 RepID=A0A917QLA4_9NOCA|nr:hypothetical protein GCM10011591_30610 [Nocardia camponoti]
MPVENGREATEVLRREPNAGASARPRSGETPIVPSPFGGSVPVSTGRDDVARTAGASGAHALRDAASTAVPSQSAVPAQADDNRADKTVRMTTPKADAPKSERWWDNPGDDGEVPKPPGDDSLSWSDDPIAKRLAPSTPIAAAKKKKSLPREWIAGGIAVAVLIVVALVMTIGLTKRGGGDDPGPTAPPIASVAAPLECKVGLDPLVTISNGPGDTTSGAKAILGFNYAFYVQRSGVQARTYVAPDSETISPADVIQRAIDEQIPNGSKHCVRIREVSGGHFDVELREWHPDGVVTVYKQDIIATNANPEGKWQLKSIAAR